MKTCILVGGVGGGIPAEEYDEKAEKIAAVNAGLICAEADHSPHHFVINSRGDVEMRRPFAEDAGIPALGFLNKYVFSVAVIGGTSPDGSTPVDNYTDPQRVSLKMVEEILRTWVDAQGAMEHLVMLDRSSLDASPERANVAPSAWRWHELQRQGR